MFLYYNTAPNSCGVVMYENTETKEPSLTSSPTFALRDYRNRGCKMRYYLYV